MATRQIWFVFLLSLMIPFSGLADIVTLNSGQKLEGKIVRDTDQNVVIDVQISAGITDQKAVDRADIASIDKPSEAQKAFSEIEGLNPGSMSYSPEQYEKIISRLDKFRTDFPGSEYDKVIQERITVIQDEQKLAASGEIEIGGAWISKEQAEKQKYQIGVQLLFEQMQQAAENGDYIGALNIFAKIEDEYPGSRAYVSTVPLAAKILTMLASDVGRRKVALARDIEVRKKGLEITSEPQKSRLIAAAEREEAQYKAAIDAAKKAGLEWPPLISRSMDSLKMIGDQIPKAQVNLSKVEIGPLSQSIIRKPKEE